MESNLPQQNQALINFIHGIYPVGIRLMEGVTSVTFAPEEWERLAALRGKRAMILCNHPTWHDPPIVFGVAGRLKESFYYAAMDELFVGVVGKIVSQLGVFPIKRGKSDRKALRICQAILTERDGKLVFFPEGEAQGRNDRVLPLGEGGDGAAQIGFWALNALAEKGKEVTLPIVTLAAFYRCHSDPTRDLERGITNIERFLGIIPGEPSLNARFRQAEQKVIIDMEREFNLSVTKDISDSERLKCFYDYIEERVCAVLNTTPPAATEVHLKIRTLYQAVYDFRDGLNVKGREATAQERRLEALRRLTAQDCYAQIERVQRWVVGGLDTPDSASSPERLAERLYRLEFELLGRQRTRLLYDVTMRVAEPFDLTEYLPVYKTARREAIHRVTTRIEAQLWDFVNQWNERVGAGTREEDSPRKENTV